MSPSSPSARTGGQIFCAFSAQDAKVSAKILDRLYDRAEGFVFSLFDEQDERKDWKETVATRIKGAKGAFFLISKHFLKSSTLMQVVDLAEIREIPCYALALEMVRNELPTFLRPITDFPGLPFPQLPPARRSELIDRIVQKLLTMVGIPSGAAKVADPETMTLPEDLVRDAVAGQIVFYGGAGMSVLAGLPSGADLVEKALDRQEFHSRFPLFLRESLLSLVRQGKPDQALEGLVEGEQIPSPEFRNFLAATYQETQPKLSLAHVALRDLNLSGIVTSNYDSGLELAVGAKKGSITSPQDADRLLGALSKKEFFALKLLGMLDRPETVLFTPARYRDAVSSNVVFGQFLSSLYFSRTLLFAGTSLERIEDFLSSIPSRTGQTPRHVALIPDSEAGWQVKAPSLKRRFGLELVALPKYERSLGKFLSRLGDEVRRRLKGAGVLAPQAYATDRLASISVQNIGPFKDLTLDLEGNWNLLLGDNGVGKSFILKAIALSIIGDEAEGSVARRMIRTGQRSANISLTTTGGSVYQTEILASESGARVKTIPTRPLEKEGWLSVGFPPLRTVSWKSPKPYEAGERARAVAGDLQPLLQGEADPRLDGLKSWLLYLDHSINAPNQTASPGLSVQKRLWDKFFEVVRKITPGMNLGKARVDATRKQVFIETDDGEVPIEAVSQGTQSLMGWIGVVLQRLFEVYEQDQDPTGRYVLILMDEIDAHMHPYWQQTLVTNLRDVFPKAQFVATSHSPLVVSGLSKEEVWIFKREGDTNRPVRVDRPLEDFKGWRVDQILTSPSFGLAGARDKKTVDLLAEYNKLVSKFGLTPEEQKRLEELAREIGATVPSPQSLPQAREASAMIEQAFQQKLNEMPSEKREKLVEELRAQVHEAVGGARRPK